MKKRSNLEIMAKLIGMVRPDIRSGKVKRVYSPLFALAKDSTDGVADPKTTLAPCIFALAIAVSLA